jgi:hypothetical protein
MNKHVKKISDLFLFHCEIISIAKVLDFNIKVKLLYRKGLEKFEGKQRTVTKFCYNSMSLFKVK